MSFVPKPRKGKGKGKGGGNNNNNNNGRKKKAGGGLIDRDEDGMPRMDPALQDLADMEFPEPDIDDMKKTWGVEDVEKQVSVQENEMDTHMKEMKKVMDGFKMPMFEREVDEGDGNEDEDNEAGAAMAKKKEEEKLEKDADLIVQQALAEAKANREAREQQSKPKAAPANSNSKSTPDYAVIALKQAGKCAEEASDFDEPVEKMDAYARSVKYYALSLLHGCEKQGWESVFAGILVGLKYIREASREEYDKLISALADRSNEGIAMLKSKATNPMETFLTRGQEFRAKSDEKNKGIVAQGMEEEIATKTEIATEEEEDDMLISYILLLLAKDAYRLCLFCMKELEDGKAKKEAKAKLAAGIGELETRIDPLTKILVANRLIKSPK